MLLYLLSTLASVAVADVSHLSLQYGPPESSYGVPQGSVTGSAKYFQTASTPPPDLRIPIREAQDFRTRISNDGTSGLSNISPFLDARFSVTTPGPVVDYNQRFASSPGLGFNNANFQSAAPGIDVNAGFAPSTQAPGVLDVGQVNSIPSLNSYGSFGLNSFSTPSPVVTFGSGQLTSVDANVFSKDADLNSVHVDTAGGYTNDAFGLSTVSPSIHSEQASPQIFKHVYFFASPEEPEQIRPRVNFVSQPKKNIKVIFIKAPSPPQIAPVQVATQSQSEEKTVVYVLVKKPEEQQEIQIHSQPAVEPQKPEVYFIKYKNQKDAEEAISKVQAGQQYSDAQLIADDVGENSFVNVISKEASLKIQPQPIVNYVKSSNVVSGPLPTSNFNLGPTISTTSSPLSSSLSYSSSAPNFGVGIQQPQSVITSGPGIGLNSGLLLTKLGSGSIADGLDSRFQNDQNPTVNLGPALVETRLQANSQVKETGLNIIPSLPEISQNYVDASVDSSTFGPQFVGSSTILPGGFISHSVTPQPDASNSLPPEYVRSGSEISAPFSQYGPPLFKK